MKFPIGISSSITTEVAYNALPKRQIFFTIGNSGTSKVVNSPGRYCPCSLRVIAPDALATKAGDIYDRYYAHEQDINATGISLETSGTTWTASYEKSTFLKSIRTLETSPYTYLKLIRASDSKTAAYLTIIPVSMREGIEKLAEDQLHLDDVYFTGVLTQLKTFLL